MYSTLLFKGLTIIATAISLPATASPPAAHHHDATPLQGVQSLDVYSEGSTIHLLQGEYNKDRETPYLLYLRSNDGGKTWLKPIQVDKGLPGAHAARRGMDAQICAHGDNVMAVWMSAGTDAFGGGPMMTVLSEDGGKTWKAGPNPADDGSTEGHGFIDLASDASGAFHLTWLDNRKGLRGLRYTRSADHGKTWAANTTPDEETCECCWNTIATGPGGMVAILYRDKAPRDMAVSVAINSPALWPAPKKVGDFGWEFNGCPHVGGGLAIGGTENSPTLHTMVWTGQVERTGVYHLASTDAGQTWSQPILFGDNTASHPDIAAKGNEVIAVWDENDRAVTCIDMARSSDGGKTWTKSIDISSDDASASHPRVVATAEGFRVFWTAQRDGSPSTVQSFEVK